MKRTYMTPAMILHPFASEVLLSSVSDAVSSSNGLKYGGVDEAGELDPSARERGTDPAEEVTDEQPTWERGLW